MVEEKKGRIFAIIPAFNTWAVLYNKKENYLDVIPVVSWVVRIEKDHLGGEFPIFEAYVLSEDSGLENVYVYADFVGFVYAENENEAKDKAKNLILFDII